MIIITLSPAAVNDLSPRERMREQYRELYRLLGKVRVSKDNPVLIVFRDEETERIHVLKIEVD